MTWLKPLLNIVLIFAAALGDRDSHDETNPYRIDKIIRPLTYQITLQPFLHDDTFSGESEMYIHIKRPTKSIVMHAANMTVEVEKVYSYPHQVEHTVEPIRSKPEKQMIEIPFNEELIPGPYSIRLKFVGNISNKTEGLFKTTYTDSERKTKSVLATYLRPTGARLVFPCWDEPAFKATFGITIRHPEEYIALSNMPVRNKIKIEGVNLMQTIFEASPVMSPYLVAFLVGQFIEQDSGLSNVQIYSLDTVSLAGSEGIQRFKYLSNLFETFLPPIIEYTENIANRSLILPEIKNVILPTIFPQNSVENWGIAVYWQGNIILDKELSTMAHKAELNILVARKLAYLGIASVVGPYWWTEIWLNEALTTFLAQITLTEVYRNHALKHYYEHKLRHEIYHTNIHNIDQKENEVSSVSEIRNVNIASINFVKGYGLLCMLEHIMSAMVFRRGVLEYLSRFVFGSATIEEFWDSLQNTLDKSEIPHKNYEIKKVMNSWLTQKHYPILNMTRNPIIGEVVITQESINLDEKAMWWIPLYLNVKKKSETTYITRSDLYWLNPDEPILKLSVHKEESFIINNIGNYRVNYDHMSWRQLADFLNSENYTSIKEMSRAQIIDDAFYLTMNGRLDSSIFLKLIQYLHREKHYIPWYTFTNALSEYSEYWKLSESGPLKASLSQSFTEVLQYVEYEDKPAEDDEKKFLRSLIIKWACNIGNILCRKAANNALMKLMKEPQESLSKLLPSMEEWTLCIGMILADSDTWLEILKTYNQTKNKQLLIHLTCIEQPVVINNYISLLCNSEREIGQTDLTKILTTPLRDSLDDSTYEKIFYSILDRHSGKSLVLEYILRNLEKIKPRNMSKFQAFIHIVNKVYSGTIIKHLTDVINPKKGTLERIIELTKEEKEDAERAISNQTTTHNTMSLIISKFKNE